MKKKLLLLIICLLLISLPLFSYTVLYAEQYYRLYHRHFYMYPDATMENMVWLERSLNANFCNPLYALAEIANENEWEHYRFLFKMHVNLKLVELHLILANGYDKQVAYFYNYPWKEENLESLEIAEELYKTGLYYWEQAKIWASKLVNSRHHLDDVQNWEDEKYRIFAGDLNYEEIIFEHLTRLYQVRADFEAMDENTY